MRESRSHPLLHGFILQSPGSQFSYRIIGSCCRLFDREQLPWPCCRIQWRGKEPSWRRIGRRFVADMAARRYASYSVELLGYHSRNEEPLIITLYTERLSPERQSWWYSRLAPALSAEDSPLSAPTGLNEPLNTR